MTDYKVGGQDYEIVLDNNTEGLGPKYYEKKLFLEDDNIVYESIGHCG